jgi:hypothetical protein
MVNAELTRADPGLIHKDPAKEHIANREQSVYIDGMPLFRAPALRSAGKGRRREHHLPPYTGS